MPARKDKEKRNHCDEDIDTEMHSASFTQKHRIRTMTLQGICLSDFSVSFILR